MVATPPTEEERQHATEVAVRELLLGRYPHADGGLSVYAEQLAGDGVLRGLLGPREAQRLWSRHIANCAVLEELIPHGAQLVDIGSGAGLPGIPLALVRPDLRISLVEPLLRRATFLADVVSALDLADRVSVVRGRAEEQGSLQADVVTARAVAPMERLAGWTLPLVRRGGILLAVKGDAAAAELSEAGSVLERLGGGEAVVVTCGVGIVDPPTTVIRVVRVHTGRRPSAR